MQDIHHLSILFGRLSTCLLDDALRERARYALAGAACAVCICHGRRTGLEILQDELSFTEEETLAMFDRITELLSSQSSALTGGPAQAGTLTVDVEGRPA